MKLYRYKLAYEHSGKKSASKKEQKFWSDTLRGAYNLSSKILSWILSRSWKSLKWALLAFKNDWVDTRKSLKKRRKVAKKIRKEGLKLDWKWVVIIGLVAWLLAPTVKSIVPETHVYKPKPSVVPSLSDTQLTHEEPQDVVVVETPPPPPPVVEAPAPVYAPVVISGCGDNEYANYIYMHESGCSTTITNYLGCYGIGQDCNGVVRNLCGADYNCENQFFTNYALTRYGSWQASYEFWLQHSWW